MAFLPSQPSALALVVPYSNSQSGSPGTVVTKYSPKDASGAVFDFSVGTWTANLELAEPTVLNPNATTPIGMIVGTADATGIQLSFDSAGGGTLAADMTTTTANATIIASDGTNQVIVASGTVALQVRP